MNNQGAGHAPRRRGGGGGARGGSGGARGGGGGARGGGAGARGGGAPGNWRARGKKYTAHSVPLAHQAGNQNRDEGASGYYRPPPDRGQDYNRHGGQSQGYRLRLNQEDGRDGRNNNRQQNRSERFMGFKILEEIAHCDNQDVLVKVNEKKTSFINLLESSIDKDDLYVLIVQIISKVCQSSFDEQKLRMLLEFCNSRFVRNLSNYMINLPYADSNDRFKNSLYWNDQNGFWNHFVAFCQSIIEIAPSIALQKCRSLIEDTSRVCLEKLKERHGFNLADEYNAQLQQLRERLTMQEKEETEKQVTLQRKKITPFDDMAPPDDFRQLSVLPTRDDLLDQEPFLRPNIVNGGYHDTEHYLDVQFRLLREDCFGPLREGINQFMKNPNMKKYDNIRVYHNVKFIEPYISKNKIGETVQLDEKAMKRFKRVNWSHSKRFIYGALLLFTKDNCRSFIIATILERDVGYLSRGKIPVSIVNKIAAGENLYSDDSSYIMIESEVYFEPYFHVLKALQDPKFPEHIAMNKYIVRVDPVPNPPTYLNQESVFKVRNKDLTKLNFVVLDETTWPTKDELEFNETQYEAYKLALTHEFAVIQGPPGTGKTYLGVKVAKTLLKNLSLDNSGKCLMLVICYTNHALDQFLENILPVTDSIVRIGGQSRNEAMEKINLTSLRKKKQINSETRMFFYDQKHNLSSAVNALKQAQEHLETINNGIISFSSLKDIPEVRVLGEYYAQHRKDIKSDPLRHWLFEHMQYEDFNNVMAEEEENEELTENNVDIDEDRFELILDEVEDEQEKYNNVDLPVKVSISFSMKEIENKLKTMIMLYNSTEDMFKQQELQQEIIELKSRANLFLGMAGNRARQTRLHINDRMDLSLISTADRWALYFRWADIITAKFKRSMMPLQKSLDSANAAYEEARMMVDLKILNGINVIGMTTSGAARLRKLLVALAPPIVVVEEAAEVLEQHIVTSLTKDCKHLILIGDHQQLRPSAAHMKLARDYNIEISLFERMIKNHIHSRRLGVQHRMRPEIAALISPHIYPELRNHSSVEQFPNVRGMTDNLFFLSHDYKEEEVVDSSSRSNQQEADMTLRLANYLVQQGYEPDDVTILAAYSGQMFYMRKERGQYAFLQKVKITVVDNYQGEESNIILLSLVRNNDQNKIGFLGTENRICVALSRARHGFYILGNIDILKRNSELWRKIGDTLEEQGSVGTSLMLKCETHPGQITMVSSPKDFEKVPEGGCLLKCNYELPCGHGCTLVCHGYDRGHLNTKCYLPCERVICELEHVCPLKCWEACLPCNRLVQKSLPCGHEKLVSCHKDPTDPSVKCCTIVQVVLPKCGHEVDKLCHVNINAVKCPVRCIYRVANCGHECLRTCHVNDDPDHEKYLCNKPCARAKKGCSENLVGDRGNHQCTRKCYESCEVCTVEVTKKRSACKHSEKVACSKNVDEDPCRKNCARMMACGHFCKKKCYEPCGDCKQKVTKIIPDCNHTIKVACMTPATRSLCTEKCERILPCGHACTERCDKTCDPKKCTQLYNKKFESPCGHQVLIPCNIYNSMAPDPNPEVLLTYCTEPCGKVLACEHVCKGTCGLCYQGRLHIACQDKCNRIQICGHLCNEPCNKVCPPCNRKCEIRCPHSRCNNICGAPCNPCQEACSRKCRHGACSRRCGEPCSRAPCDAACPLRLPCGHRCRGLCGEPCPDICNHCRPDDFPTDFLGDEYEDDDKFVQLQDCGHVLDVENMDNLMKGDQETISIRQCPFCRVPILNTQRYKDLVNHTLKTEINPIKEKVFGNEDVIKNKRNELCENVEEFHIKYQDTLKGNPDCRVALSKLGLILKNPKFLSLPKLETLFQYLQILDIIGEYDQKYRETKLKVLETDFRKLIKLICTVLLTNIHKISQQLQQDIGNELKRMNSIIQLEKILNHTFYLNAKSVPQVKQATDVAIQVVLSSSKFGQDKAMIVLKQVEEAVKISGIVTKEERDLIVKAIGSKSGSWYKCPNGHFYSISDCGGAMVVSKCADCGVAIGGQNHTLLSDNAHAGELDGSTFAAWSNEYNNMANWEL